MSGKTPDPRAIRRHAPALALLIYAPVLISDIKSLTAAGTAEERMAHTRNKRKHLQKLEEVVLKYMVAGVDEVEVEEEPAGSAVVAATATNKDRVCSSSSSEQGAAPEHKPAAHNADDESSSSSHPHAPSLSTSPSPVLTAAERAAFEVELRAYLRAEAQTWAADHRGPKRSHSVELRDAQAARDKPHTVRMEAVVV